MMNLKATKFKKQRRKHSKRKTNQEKRAHCVSLTEKLSLYTIMGSISLNSFFKPISTCQFTTKPNWHCVQAYTKSRKSIQRAKTSSYSRDVNTVVLQRSSHSKGCPINPSTTKIEQIKQEEKQRQCS